MFYLPGCVAVDAITPGWGPPTPELNAEGKLFLYKSLGTEANPSLQQE